MLLVASRHSVEYTRWVSSGLTPYTERLLVRTHPATGKKYLFISPLAGHSGRVFGYKKEESDYLLHFLQDTLLRGGDFQARARYRPGTVVIWDKRVS